MKFDRQFDMERYIASNGATSLAELCRHYDVSMSTVRRDIAELVRRKSFCKIYGGVAAGCAESAGPASAARCGKGAYARQVIGRLAAQLVQDDMSVFLDSGPIPPQILPFLTEKRNITVVSCSLAALSEAANYPSLHVIALGGMYNGTSSSFLGGNTADELAKMSIDLVFLSATGISLSRGLTDAGYSETEIKRTVVKWNRNLALMADHSIFGREALLPFCRFEDLGAIITDLPPEDEFLQASVSKRVRLLTPASAKEYGAAQAVLA